MGLNGLSDGRSGPWDICLLYGRLRAPRIVEDSSVRAGWPEGRCEVWVAAGRGHPRAWRPPPGCAVPAAPGPDLPADGRGLVNPPSQGAQCLPYCVSVRRGYLPRRCGPRQTGSGDGPNRNGTIPTRLHQERRSHADP